MVSSDLPYTPFSHKQTKLNQLKSLGSAKRLRQTLNRVAMIHNEHDRHTGNLANTSLQIFIARCYNITTILSLKSNSIPYCANTLDNTVISIGSLVRTSETLETRILC